MGGNNKDTVSAFDGFEGITSHWVSLEGGSCKEGVAEGKLSSEFFQFGGDKDSR